MTRFSISLSLSLVAARITGSLYIRFMNLHWANIAVIEGDEILR